MGHDATSLSEESPMATKMTRKIVHIDEEKCNGCGECVPSCAEGALRIIDGKARLVAENLCNGLGACLGNCPMGAITVEEQPAEEFDEQAVQQHLQRPASPDSSVAPMSHGQHSGCPGSRMRMLRPAAAQPPAAASSSSGASRLAHWPVQLALVPVTGPIWENADVLIAADCVPFAYPDFHEKLLAGKTLAIACPKLDDVSPYVQKLAAIFSRNTIRSVTVAHMEVPCCSGIVRVVQAAIAQAGRRDIVVHDVTVGIDGRIQ